MGEGLGSIFSAAIGYAPTLFSYFNPSRSPYYAMSVACIVGLCVLFLFDQSSWIAAFVPLSVVLVTLAIATMRSPKILFTVDEYNDQLKYARSLAVTTAAICIVFIAHNPQNPLGYGSIMGGVVQGCAHGCDSSLRWSILVVYLFCIAQILLFLAYAYVFASYQEITGSSEGLPKGAVAEARVVSPREERNYVQVALIMCAYLAGMTWVTDRASKTFPFEILTVMLFGGVWIVCALHVLRFVYRNFSLAPPIDVVPLRPAPSNVITFKQVQFPGDAATGT